MATSSSDESCSAVNDFDISLEDSNGKFNSMYERCPLCTKCKRAFHCKDCIRKGDFMHSKYSQFIERFADKKIRLFEVTRDGLLAQDRIKLCVQKSLKADELKTKIEACQRNIKLLKVVVAETREASKIVKSEIKILSSDINTQNVSLHKKYRKKVKMQQYIKEKQHTFNNHLSLLNDRHRSLKTQKRRSVTLLFEHIFPVTKVCPEERQDDSSNGETVSALADASRTAYIRGRWVYLDNSGDLQYRIVEPLLPGNGDYSAYNVRVTSVRESGITVASESGHRNPGSAIGGAITYLCQFVSLLALHLDVLLPHKLNSSEFCSHELKEEDFAHKVAKLNANVVHLCLSQSINPEALHPKRTAANISLLLDPELCDLGRYGPIEVNPEVMNSMEESLLQDLHNDDDEEDLDNFCDWETIAEVPDSLERVTASAMPYGQLYQPGMASHPTSDGSTSMAGGLAMTAVASIASFWRGAFGAK